MTDLRAYLRQACGVPVRDLIQAIEERRKERQDGPKKRKGKKSNLSTSATIQKGASADENDRPLSSADGQEEDRDEGFWT
jgi:hypothetical protein